MLFRKKVKHMMHPIFGEINLEGNWYGMTEINLWNNDFDLMLTLQNEYKKSEISSKQEEAYEFYKKHKSKLQTDIEQFLKEYFREPDEEVILARYCPSELIVEQDGVVKLCMTDNEQDIDHEDHFFDFIILPEVRIF